MNNGEREATIQWKQEISLWREIGPEVDLGLICSNYNNESTNVSSSSESEENDTLRGLVLCVQAEDCRFPGEQTTQNAMVIGRPRGTGMGGKRPELGDESWIFYWLCDHGRITRAQWALFSSSTQDLIKIKFMRCMYRYSIRVWGETTRTSICIHFYHILFLNFYFAYVFNAHSSTIVKLCGQNSMKTTHLECWVRKTRSAKRSSNLHSSTY